jgi:hypothetical protein
MLVLRETLGNCSELEFSGKKATKRHPFFSDASANHVAEVPKVPGSKPARGKFPVHNLGEPRCKMIPHLPLQSWVRSGERSRGL